MKKIQKLWFEKNRIFIKTNEGHEYSRPLEAFPRLLEATKEQRDAYTIGNFGDDVRWESVDEDIHISSFFIEKEPNEENPIAQLFSQFPQLNVSQFAQSIGINKSLMSQYIYGTKTPSEERLKKIETALHIFADELKSVHLV